MSSEEEIESYFNFVLPLIEEAGRYFLQSKNKTIEVENKSVHDLVTKYDKDIEEILVGRIKAKYPDHKFIGEESTESKNEKPVLTNAPTWIVDPVDGTSNFARKIPLSGISVGLTINKEQVLGIVSIPYLKETYTAIKGRGAKLNGEKIQCSKVKEPEKALFCYEIAVASKTPYHNVIMTRLSHFIKQVQAVRAFGCPVLAQCYVASGKLDAYLCDGLYPWDAAAGTIIVKEAGGCVVESTGKQFDLMKPDFLVACTEELCEKLIEIVKKADEERDKLQ